MNELREHVLQSLRERPTLNTPTLIAGGDLVPTGTDPGQVEAILDDLVAEGVVKHRATGWKLAPQAG